MSSTQQAKDGFKTFITTFVVSLVVFGAFYYFVSDSAANDVSIEDASSAIGYTATPEQSAGAQPSIQGASADSSNDNASPFGELARQEVNVDEKTVLAGATQTTQSTVPETGTASITIGLISSLLLFALFIYIVFINPRKYALSRFEKRVIEKLD